VARARAALAEIFAERMPGFERAMLAFLLRKASELLQDKELKRLRSGSGISPAMLGLAPKKN